MYGFILAGTNSGCGKTTTSIGLMALLKSLGKKVAPFKTGPDYIDPLFHSRVLGTPSYNLDSYMLPRKTVKHLFNKHIQNHDVAVVEGVMGMYDGLGIDGQGSSHELSTILGLPLVLVVSCKSLYQSVAAIVKGFATLKPSANVKGVILNHVPTDDYYHFLKKVIEENCKGVTCIGYVPTNKDISLESRHLGLVQAEEVGNLDKKVNHLVQTLSKTIDVNKLLEISSFSSSEETTIVLPKIDLSDLKIGIAYDKAFRFYYKDNLELLEQLGASLSYFSPIGSKQLPKGINCLYLGGGYPEVFANELSQNKGIMAAISQKVEEGLPVYGECGGLMYLCKEIVSLTAEKHKMAGVFNASVQMTKGLQHFGYANLEYNGQTIACHEFHHSKVVNETTPNYNLVYGLSQPDKGKEWKCGLQHKNCLAGYAHVHFYSNFDFFKEIVSLWRNRKL